MTQPTALADFKITKKWPPQQPELLQLYAFPTPNGVKVSIALAEMGLAYENHTITLDSDGVLSEAFLSLNPNNKIPAIIDPNGPDGKAIGLFESGAILIYLAEKTGKLLGDNAQERFDVLQWLMFQMGGVGPMFGQLGYFSSGQGAEIDDPRPKQRYADEAKRLLKVIDQQVSQQDWIAGSFSIADIAMVPWLQGITRRLSQETGIRDFQQVMAYIERFNNRPAIEMDGDWYVM